MLRQVRQAVTRAPEHLQTATVGAQLASLAPWDLGLRAKMTLMARKAPAVGCRALLTMLRYACNCKLLIGCVVCIPDS